MSSERNFFNEIVMHGIFAMFWIFFGKKHGSTNKSSKLFSDQIWKESDDGKQKSNHG